MFSQLMRWMVWWLGSRRGRLGRAMSKCRNDFTHLEGLREQYDIGDLYWLAEAVFNVTRLCLLLHVGMPREPLPKLTKSWPVQGT
jgi:hypothetical protein